MAPLVRFARSLAALPPLVKLWVMLGCDAVALPLCMLAAVTLRFGSLEEALATALAVQLILGLSTIPVLALAGLYRALVRYIDLRVLVAAGASLGAVVAVVYLFAVAFHVQVLPRSSLLSYWFIAFSYVVSSRFVARKLLRRGLRPELHTRTRTAIYGAGDAGAQLAQAMQFSSDYRAICFFDDSPRLRGKNVAGLKVYSPKDLAEALFRHEVAQIVVAIPSASTADKRRLISQLEGTGLPVKILPGLVDLVDGRAGVSAIREVDVSDLLGRDPVPPNPTLFSRDITGRAVLVTGAGGSIGSELCRQILTQGPSHLVLLDHSEYALYVIDHELRQQAGNCTISSCLGSVLDEDLLRRLFGSNKIETVYHAAAYKHVPIVEANSREGVRNNVFGSLAVATAALEANVRTCVLISTDKAVRPTSVMGVSKRVAELAFQATALKATGRTTFSIVRFGNVLGSSGSVVPLFRRQIRDGGPITITHPDVIRYFMLIPEAAQLVIQAGAMAKGGDVFVLDMGEPVRIAELARSMIRLSGLREKSAEHPDGIAIQAIGLRPGEKLFEELLIDDDVVASAHPRIRCARERHIEPPLLDKMLASLRQACASHDEESLLRQLRNLVPEFRPADEVNAEASALLARGLTMRNPTV